MQSSQASRHLAEDHGHTEAVGMQLFNPEQRAALAADDSVALRSVCEVLVSVICAGLAMMVFTVWWIVS